MYMCRLTFVLFLYVSLSFITAQSNLPIKLNLKFPINFQIQQYVDSSLPLLPSTPSRIKLFSDAFVDAVKNSTQLLQVFDVSAPPYEDSVNLFNAARDIMVKANVGCSDSLAKTLADALYLTLPFMTLDAFAYGVADTIAIYLISQNFLTYENAASYGILFSDALLKSYPGPNEISSSTMIAVLPAGMTNFLLSIGVFPPERAPAVLISCAKHFFAETIVIEPSKEVSVVDPLGTIDSAAAMFGIDVFTLVFSQHVERSSALRNIFYLNEPASVVSNAWKGALELYCKGIGCHESVYYNMQAAVLSTYSLMSKTKYVKCIANGYALFLLQIGQLVWDTASDSAHNLALKIESCIVNTLLNADLSTQFLSILQGLNFVLKPGSIYVDQLYALTNLIEVEFYSATATKKRITV